MPKVSNNQIKKNVGHKARHHYENLFSPIGENFGHLLRGDLERILYKESLSINPNHITPHKKKVTKKNKKKHCFIQSH